MPGLFRVTGPLPVKKIQGLPVLLALVEIETRDASRSKVVTAAPLLSPEKRRMLGKQQQDRRPRGRV